MFQTFGGVRINMDGVHGGMQKGCNIYLYVSRELFYALKNHRTLNALEVDGSYTFTVKYESEERAADVYSCNSWNS
jgi:hypothetical protein